MPHRAELLQVRSDNNQRMSYKSTLKYFDWLRDRISRNEPFDQLVQELLTSNGGTFENGDGFLSVELSGNGHSVVTERRDDESVKRVLAFFHERLDT